MTSLSLLFHVFASFTFLAYVCFDVPAAILAFQDKKINNIFLSSTQIWPPSLLLFCSSGLSENALSFPLNQASDWIFFHLVLSAPSDQKKLKILQPLYHPDCGSQVQIIKTGNWYRKHMRGFNFVPIRSNPMLIFLRGNRPLSPLQELIT